MQAQVCKEGGIGGREIEAVDQHYAQQILHGLSKLFLSRSQSEPI